MTTPPDFTDLMSKLVRLGERVGFKAEIWPLIIIYGGLFGWLIAGLR